MFFYSSIWDISKDKEFKIWVCGRSKVERKKHERKRKKVSTKLNTSLH